MNVNEWGVLFVFSTGFDMSGFTSIAIEFTKPDGSHLTVTNPLVSVPNSGMQTTAGLFVAKKYAEYTFAPGDVDQVGEWTVRLTYEDLNQKLICDVGTFTIRS